MRVHPDSYRDPPRVQNKQSECEQNTQTLLFILHNHLKNYLDSLRKIHAFLFHKWPPFTFCILTNSINFT